MQNRTDRIPLNPSNRTPEPKVTSPMPATPEQGFNALKDCLAEGVIEDAATNRPLTEDELREAERVRGLFLEAAESAINKPATNRPSPAVVVFQPLGHTTH
jgi:hypothetical protein